MVTASDAWQLARTTRRPFCGVPGAIKIASNVANGQTGHLKLTFGITGRATAQNQVQVAGLPFHIVATQSGHKPGDANF